MQDASNTQETDLSRDHIDLKEVFSILLLGKKTIIFITAFASIIVVIYSLMLPNIYEAEALLVGVNSSNSNNPLEQYSGIASLAGIDIDGQKDGNKEQAIDKMYSLSFFENNILPFIFLPELMAVKSWIPKENLLVFKKDIYDDVSNKWIRDFTFPRKQIPSAQESYEVFKKHIIFSKDKKTGFIKLKVKHQSPYVAKQWAELIIDQINYYYREKDKLEAKLAVDYLNVQMSNTRFTEIKQVIAQLLQQEQQKLTLVEAKEAYVFEYIDPPALMELKSQPRRAFICIIGALLGGILGCLIVLVRHFRSNESSA